MRAKSNHLQVYFPVHDVEYMLNKLNISTFSGIFYSGCVCLCIGDIKIINAVFTQPALFWCVSECLGDVKRKILSCILLNLYQGVHVKIVASCHFSFFSYSSLKHHEVEQQG